jgi:multisubunit Na+/H+ antiporter MnhB subunit
MSHGDCFILIGMGGLFILLGLAAFIWGKREEKSYYNSISTRHDVREFLEHEPARPEPGALKIGGWIAIAIGLLMLVMGGAFLLWG